MKSEDNIYYLMINFDYQKLKIIININKIEKRKKKIFCFTRSRKFIVCCLTSFKHVKRLVLFFWEKNINKFQLRLSWWNFDPFSKLVVLVVFHNALILIVLCWAWAPLKHYEAGTALLVLYFFFFFFFLIFLMLCILFKQLWEALLSAKSWIM